MRASITSLILAAAVVPCLSAFCGDAPTKKPTLSPSQAPPKGDIVVQHYFCDEGLRLTKLRFMEYPAPAVALCAHGHRAETLFSPDGRWIAVTDYTDTGGSEVALYRKKGGVDFERIEGVDIAAKAWQFFADENKLEEAPNYGPKYTEVLRWSEDSKSALLSIRAFSDSEDHLDPWLCVLDVETLTLSLDLRKINESALVATESIVTERTYRHGYVDIRITQAKPTSEPGKAPSSFIPKARFEVTRDGELIRLVSYPQIDAVGGSYGLFVPKVQPVPGFFFIVKCGDYDGHLFIVDKRGNIVDLPGGCYFVTPDKRFVFSIYESDMGGLAVYDFHEDRIVFHSKTLDPEQPHGWYRDSTGYFFTEWGWLDGAQGDCEIHRFNFATKSIEEQRIDAADLAHAEKVPYDFDPQDYEDGTCAPSAEAPAIAVTEHIVFDGEQGWEHEGITYRLACAAAVKQAPNGDLLCWWLSGSGGEPATDNNVLMARSTNKGWTWSEPRVFVPAGEMAGAVTCMYPTSDGRLVAFGAHWPSEMRYTVWHYFRMESTDNGHTWSEPEPVSLHNDNIAFGSPIKLDNGEYLFAASFFDKRPEPLVAPVSALVHAKSEAEALAMPKGEGNRHDEKFSTHRHGCSVLISPDENAREFKEYGYIANRPLGLLEPSCIQLKDGRIALLHNACGEVGKMIPRDPLSIWLSDDELETWSIKADVLTGGWLAYPCGLVLDGKLVFTYDRNRRQARFVEVEIPPAMK